MEKRTVLDHVRVYPNGEVEAHLHCFIQDGNNIIAGKHHVGVLEPGGWDPDAFLIELNKSVVDHLQYPALDAAQWQLLKTHLAVVSTPEMIEKWDAIRKSRLQAPRARILQ